MKPERMVVPLLLLLLGACGSAVDAPMVPGGALRVGAVLGDTEHSGFARAEAPRAFRFPRDHGPHPAFRSEWWYLTATLADDAGREFGVQFTIFRQALAPPARSRETAAGDNRWATPQVYLGHLAVTDVRAGTHQESERFARGHPVLAGARAAPFAVWLEDWRLEEQGDRWRLKAGSDALALDLELDSGTPVYLQGEQGLSRKGPGQASYYYSMPGMGVSGRLTVGGREHRVRGSGWLDREWSTSVLSAGQLGWDWFALKLDDGRALMAFQLRRGDGHRDAFDQGLLVSAGGNSRALTAADFKLEPQRAWTDDGGVRWPVEWILELSPTEVPGRGAVPERFRVRALVDDQRMDTSVRYWEGIVAVEDPAGERLGRGYLEMTGYDGEERAAGAVDDEQEEFRE